MGSDAERVRKDEQKKNDESDVLNEEELAEKEDLLKQVKNRMLNFIFALLCKLV